VVTRAFFWPVVFGFWMGESSMSLEKQDMGKLHFTQPVRQIIHMLAAEKNMSAKNWMEWVIEGVCMREAHRAIIRSDSMRRSGIDGIFRDSVIDPEQFP
jgi:hypothetical protein